MYDNINVRSERAYPWVLLLSRVSYQLRIVWFWKAAKWRKKSKSCIASRWLLKCVRLIFNIDSISFSIIDKAYNRNKLALTYTNGSTLFLGIKTQDGKQIKIWILIIISLTKLIVIEPILSKTNNKNKLSNHKWPTMEKLLLRYFVDLTLKGQLEVLRILIHGRRKLTVLMKCFLIYLQRKVRVSNQFYV